MTASTVGDNNTVRWYAEATGGTASTLAPRPNTDRPGTFRYYAAQLNTNNCESDRAEVIVEVKEASPAPATTNVGYCAGAPANPLSAVAASGGVLTWYTAAAGGNGAAAPTPSTSNPGSQTFYVTQSVNGGCESQRVPVTVTVNAIPGAPSPNVPGAYCQNASPAELTASGSNLKWYEAAAGGTGSGTLRPTTAEAGAKTYYVTQTVNNCESARSSVVVTVKALPGAPTTTTPGTVCQFAPSIPFSAAGQNLAWYNTDDTPTNGTPTVTTDAGKTLLYKVAQTVDGCVSPKATISVTVQTTPVPVVSRSIVEACQGGSAQPLEATGTNLRWTDPTGLTTATAPTPPTINATKNPDGDPFYVTQTGANGCESPKATIRLFVQTVPTLSLSSSTTVNLGQEAPIKLAFTGVGPYSYTLSGGLAGVTTKDTTVVVLPTQSTFYRVTQVQNRCGVGLPGTGTVMVTVLVARIQTAPLTTTTLCAGQALTAIFATSGTFNAGSIFKLQLAKAQGDSATAQFIEASNLQSSGAQVSGNVPASLAGGQYWVRVMATNPKIPILGSISPTLLTIRTTPTATLTGTQRIYETQVASLSVTFTGDAPWTVTYRDSSYATGAVGAIQTVNTTANPYVLDAKPAKTTAYVLTSVSNNCGAGLRPTSSVVITVDPLLATEEAFTVEAFPIPVLTSVQLRINGVTPLLPADITVSDLIGKRIHHQRTVHELVTLPLDGKQAGTYIIQVRMGNQTVSRRILKH